MIGTLARKRMHLVALAALVALVAAMFVAFSPAGAQTSKSASGKITLSDTDGVVKAGASVNFEISASTTGLENGGTVALRAVQVGGPGSLPISNVPDTLPDSQDLVDDNGGYTWLPLATTAAADKLTVSVPLGTPAGDYTISAVLYFDENGASTDVTTGATRTFTATRVATAKLTVGDPGTNVASAVLSLSRTRAREEVTAITADPNADPPVVGRDAVTPITKRHALPSETADTSPESPSATAGDEVFMSATVLNSLGKPANSPGITGISISAPGGTITQKILTPVVALETASPTDGQTGENSVSITGTDGADAMAVTYFVVTKASAGTVDVTVTAIGSDGFARSDTITLTFTGDADAISLSDASESLLNHYIDHDTGEDDTDTDGRDNIALQLTATDKAGNAVVPTGTATITIKDPEGTLVEKNKIIVTQTVKATTNTVALRVAEGVAATKPLKSGEYSVEAKDGAKKATATFVVAGKTDSITLVADDMTPSEIGQTVTVTATLIDADGNPVADGTEVTFTPTGSNAGVPIANRTGGTGVVKTKGGEAKALYVIATSGPGIISAVADGKSATVVLASTAGAAPAEEEEPEVVSLDCLSRTTGFATYTCGVDSSASELFALLASRGATAIHLHNGSAWVRYAMVDGAMVPGSMDFAVQTNDVLYISY